MGEFKINFRLQDLDKICPWGSEENPSLHWFGLTIETLKEISDNDHVLIMLADPDTSVNRFFERPDGEKQFLYQLLMDEENPKLAIENFRQCLRRINSRENYDSFLHSGFRVIVRDENRSIEDTFTLVEKELGLQG